MSSMKVKVKNSTNLEELRLKREWGEELPDESTIGDFLAKLNLERLKEENGSISSLVTIEKNGKAVRTTSEKLEDEDTIRIMPRLMR